MLQKPAGSTLNKSSSPVSSTPVYSVNLVQTGARNVPIQGKGLTFSHLLLLPLFLVLSSLTLTTPYVSFPYQCILAI